VSCDHGGDIASAWRRQGLIGGLGWIHRCSIARRAIGNNHNDALKKNLAIRSRSCAHQPAGQKPERCTADARINGQRFIV
jgi:hypothetical protein